MRIALDTSVLVRLVTDDDPAQARLARRHLEGRDLFLAKTVVLETEWVLRYAYGLERANIVQVLHGILGLGNLLVETLPDVLAAVTLYERGLDLADALHLTSAHGCDHLATFDRKLARVVEKVKAPTRVTLLG